MSRASISESAYEGHGERQMIRKLLNWLIGPSKTVNVTNNSSIPYWKFEVIKMDQWDGKALVVHIPVGQMPTAKIEKYVDEQKPIIRKAFPGFDNVMFCPFRNSY